MRFVHRKALGIDDVRICCAVVKHLIAVSVYVHELRFICWNSSLRLIDVNLSFGM